MKCNREEYEPLKYLLLFYGSLCSCLFVVSWKEVSTLHPAKRGRL